MTDFDVVGAYKRALEDEQVPHPIAAILALVELMEASTASTISGLTMELTAGRKALVESQHSLGVRAGCQLWERFISLSHSGEEFPAYKKSLIAQGRAFCSVTAPQCREKIATLAVDFLVDDCTASRPSSPRSTVLTHSYSRTVIQTILRAHKQHKRIKVYVTEARPHCLGLRTHAVLTAAGIPCVVVLDSAVAYIMERVDMVLVGSEAVVESGGLVSSAGTYQTALIAKHNQKPFYALAESYKFLRHYPLSQTDLPFPKVNGKAPPLPLSFPATITPFRPIHTPSQGGALTPTRESSPHAPATPLLSAEASTPGKRERAFEMTPEMEALNPLVDVTTPDLIDFIITDLGAPLSPTSVSQYLVAQFSA
ncbi:hypothetical protein DB88DRAFT_444396 [Papiliotrema laurentii]|uniref:Translation initiation factor eIF2B subunit alpha n=1 Tax=Papiliotrema laurentii TaxID=5418 RepID=A0AAD9CS74_PAPLA|nr:hypothetical protein DB88DRAFT_444396 [Papiliotrema laurentii]